MPLIPFPNVPALPGVPPLARAPFSQAVDQLIALTADDPGIAGSSAEPKWGIFDADGETVAAADSVLSFEHAKDWRLADYPVEPNGFETYNKVERPYEERITFAKGGSESERSEFLKAVGAAAGSMDLYSVITPEVTYTNANIIRFDYRRAARGGVTLLIVEVALQEVRVTAAAAFTNTQDPASAAPQSGGTVQAQEPTTTQSAAISGGVT